MGCWECLTSTKKTCVNNKPPSLGPTCLIRTLDLLPILSALAKRLLGAKRELREMAFKVLGGGLDKRLLGVGVV